MVTQCLNAFFFCRERIKKLPKAECKTMFIAVLFLIAKKEKLPNDKKKEKLWYSDTTV